MSGKSGSDSSSVVTALRGKQDHTLYITGWDYHQHLSCYHNTHGWTQLSNGKTRNFFFQILINNLYFFLNLSDNCCDFKAVLGW